uniref:Bardet-Biedl syndrome 5 protein n=1 Tax=Syphacia muris TaxID=451379 RepID=A0A0N5ANT9_9BILA
MENCGNVWQDRDIRFDLDFKCLRLIPGEKLLEKIESVEDTKGNNGDKGTLRITNIRLIWYANQMPRINLSIGYNAVKGITTRLVSTKLRCQCESLYIVASNASSRFEFIFTCLNPWQRKLYATVIGLHRAYETSKLYREVKLRGSLLNDDDQLRILPMETQCERIDGVWNLSREQGTLGCMILTNVRVVWYSAMNNLYNASIPYMRVRCIRTVQSKFGQALVIETTAQSHSLNGSIVLGFRVDPIEKLKEVCKSMQVLHCAFIKNPNFGVQYKRDQSSSPQAVGKAVESIDDDVEVDQRPLRPDAYAAYYADGVGKTEVRPPVFCRELGVSVEQLKPGFTITDLWNINVD